jgi:hypothetical protein
MKSKSVVSSITGNNADLILSVAELYIPKTNKTRPLVIDLTYGKGVFWRRLPKLHRWFNLVALDICPQFKYVKKADFTKKLSYRNVDVIVLDPPYLHNPGAGHGVSRKGFIASERYGNTLTQKFYYHDIMSKLYIPAMKHSHTALKPGGFLWVKCKDQVESSKQRWAHFDLHKAAIDIGFTMRDLFVITPNSRIPYSSRWNVQLHARKNHSFLLIFQKP